MVEICIRFEIRETLFWDGNQLMNVEAKLDQVTKAIQDKPVPNIEMGEITQSYITMTKRVVSGKGVTTSKFKVD